MIHLIHLYFVGVFSLLPGLNVSEVKDGLELLLAILELLLAACSLWQLYRLSQVTKRDNQ